MGSGKPGHRKNAGAGARTGCNVISKCAGLLLHFSYDRVFQTPSFENILMSNSVGFGSLNPNFPRLPVEPSEGNYYEAGATKILGGKVRLDANYFRRLVANAADDDQSDKTRRQFPHPLPHQ